MPSSGTLPRVTSAGLSLETQALINKLGDSLNPSKKVDEAEAEDELKVIFCSRTHSQLSQFVNELRRVKMPPSIPPEPLPSHGTENGPIKELTEDVKHLALGSRKNLCINPKVKKLGNATAINERCLELQQPSTPKASKCKFMPNREREAFVNDFRDHALAKIRDIEDLGRLGEQIGICPYYASRAVIKPSEIVSLPYPLLLQKSAREALNLSLKDHIVIVDEAHNLIDTISEIHSVSVSLLQLKRARSRMTLYLQRFRNRLKGKNRVYVTQLVRLLDSLVAYLESKRQNAGVLEGIAHVGDLMSGKGVDQINLYKLMHYMQESKLARKVDGYTEFTDQQNRQNNGREHDASRASVPVLMQIQSFMLALTYPSAEGRFFYSGSGSGSSGANEAITLKYLLLDPVHHFREIVEEARAVILAGGTMSPMDDYARHLLDYLPRDRITTLSCGHVIPRRNLIAMPISAGPRGSGFEFTFERRNASNVLQDLGRAVLRAAKAVPDGLVVFFPSYAYLEAAIRSWQDKHGTSSLWDELSDQKRIFMEASSNATSARDTLGKNTSSNMTDVTTKHQKVEDVLAAYTAHIHDPSNTRGALLFAVIGGSLSEGINFADRLGRGIIVVGLPFPNAHSPEWKAKLEFVEKRAKTPAERVGAAREYSTNACMRAVNQSIGRAIRHKDDYAAIMLFDKRYRREGIQGKLPAWIRESLVVQEEPFEGSMKRLETFFEDKKA